MAAPCRGITGYPNARKFVDEWNRGSFRLSPVSSSSGILFVTLLPRFARHAVVTS